MPMSLRRSRQFINGAAILLGVDDGGGEGDKPRQIGDTTDLPHRGLVVEVTFNVMWLASLPMPMSASPFQRCAHVTASEK